MKKVFLSALIVCSACMAMISCNNGDYDTNPNTNNSNVPNPFYNGGGGNGGSGGQFGLGSIWAKVNGTQMSMSGRAMDTLGLFMIYGARTAAPFNAFQFGFFTYDGKKVYEIDENQNAGVTFGYYSFDGASPKIYQAGGIATKAHMKLDVTEDDGKEIKGTFDGVAYYITSGGSIDPSDSVVITEGKFHVSRK